MYRGDERNYSYSTNQGQQSSSQNPTNDTVTNNTSPQSRYMHSSTQEQQFHSEDVGHSEVFGFSQGTSGIAQNQMTGSIGYLPQHHQHSAHTGSSSNFRNAQFHHQYSHQQQPNQSHHRIRHNPQHHPHSYLQSSHHLSNGPHGHLSHHQHNRRHYQQHHPSLEENLQHQQGNPYSYQSMSRRIRSPKERPLYRLSVSLISTYKQINRTYYEERSARRATRARVSDGQQGLNNNGWDDENYDYIITSGEIFVDRYKILERIGKGSFGQVVRAVDNITNEEVAIKIIKSKKPFLMQAKTEIDLLASLSEKADQNNIVKLVTHFMYRNHQCLVFEMLSLNLYELLKNTQFCGVSLNLIRKFAKQILKSLSFLCKPTIDIIHCDLKPENILLRHPKRSGVKVIDFGSSCKSNKQMYSYIQSRFYRSPEVMLGLPYSVAIDVWSLGCILVEMHTGEPLFSGSDQFDQMQKIVKVLGMIPSSMIDRSNDEHRLQFFERSSLGDEWVLKQRNSSGSSSQGANVTPSLDPKTSLAEVIGAETNRKKKFSHIEQEQSSRSYDSFVDLIFQMLTYNPQKRIKPDEALRHPFIQNSDNSLSSGSSNRRRQTFSNQNMIGGSSMSLSGNTVSRSSKNVAPQNGSTEPRMVIGNKGKTDSPKNNVPSPPSDN